MFCSFLGVATPVVGDFEMISQVALAVQLIDILRDRLSFQPAPNPSGNSS